MGAFQPPANCNLIKNPTDNLPGVRQQKPLYFVSYRGSIFSNFLVPRVELVRSSGHLRAFPSARTPQPRKFTLRTAPPADFPHPNQIFKNGV
uniref:Uncharacterized protein n=1 Tax=Knipowitschia caucasica TaxID=637954 RepID=A0AAV2LFZ8_KNICA